MSIIGTRYKYHQYTAQAPMLATLQQADAHCLLNAECQLDMHVHQQLTWCQLKWNVAFDSGTVYMNKIIR